MTTYAFPAVTPSKSTLELVSNTRSFVSPLTNAIQTTNRKGSYWKISMEFKNLTGADRATMQAFIASLNGMEHRFSVQDHSFTSMRGAGGGTLLVNGAGQTGSTLNADGATASTTNYLRPGDYISFNNELHMVTTDASSNGSGEVSIVIAPPIRKPTNDNDVIDYSIPVSGIFILTSPAGWDNRPGGFSTLNIEGIEDVLA